MKWYSRENNYESYLDITKVNDLLFIILTDLTLAVEEGPQMLVPQDVALGVEEGLEALVPLGVVLVVEEDEEYALGFAFLVALRVGLLPLVVLDEVLPLVHALGGYARRRL